MSRITGGTADRPTGAAARNARASRRARSMSSRACEKSAGVTSSGHGGGGEDRLEAIALGEPSLATAFQIHADHMKWNRSILDAFEVDMTLQQTAEATAR